MRRFAFGVLNYSPGRFGKMLVVDFLDAMGGYNEAENERFKRVVGTVRKATTILRNTQPLEGGPVTMEELWPLPWDEKQDAKVEIISDEEAARRQQAQEDILNDLFTK